ncbi:branched-chain alpha-keto acid dehydrogenase subunit E2 [Arthrobacter sp. RIT-PI-e]|uniref:dihydrolipoamide acetyltransferase family protein n=1 Tax=Arthrobacter sp. RIT-PI-e TaxID=1681197 RepID=UPI00067607D0|nr:dihydrolipoamide acetyltransferase family protein [Arthrobacter sp. RIT-PI-e]KNC19025.1 branched-chain alpha-keto acid dehydrogenase subunit E2 [Arthrobacter sp. RIT-PI-e]
MPADPHTTDEAPGDPAASGRVREFRLPDLGEGLTESEILRWHVAEGEVVELNQVIADVETAKAVVELPSPCAGVVLRLLEGAGTVVEVGTPIISFTLPVPGASPGAPQGPTAVAGGEPGTPDAGGAPRRREPTLVGYGATPEQEGRPRRRSRSVGRACPGSAPQLPEPEGPPLAERRAPLSGPRARPTPDVPPAAGPPAPPVTGSAVPHPAERPRSTPPVRKLARDLGIALDTLTGSGPGALITREDVLAALTQPPTPREADGPRHVDPAGPGTPREAPAGRATPPGEARLPIRGIRKLTAAAMVSSAFTAPHATEFLTIDVTPTLELLEEVRRNPASTGTRITMLSVVAKAVCIAAARNPSLNSSWDERAQEIVQYAGVNLGIAAATPRGLVVPNIKGAERLTLLELARALAALTETARSGRTTPAALAGGTLSITNIGVFGIDAGTPILTPGEAAILAVGAVRRMPWEYRDAVALRSVLTLSLSFDHRLVDGEQGSHFLADVGTILSRPAMVLAMV